MPTLWVFTVTSMWGSVLAPGKAQDIFLVWGRRRSSQHRVAARVATACLHSRLWSSQQSCFHLNHENLKAQRNFKVVASHSDRGKQSWKNLGLPFPKAELLPHQQVGGESGQTGGALSRC